MEFEMYVDLKFTIVSPDGFHYEVASDPDGLSNVMLTYHEDEKKEPLSSICINEEAIPMLIKALQRHYDLNKEQK